MRLKLFEDFGRPYKKLVPNFSEKEVIDIPIGAESHLDLKLVDGKIVLEVKQVGADGSVSLQVAVSPKPLLEKLKALIPGSLDDLIIDAAVDALLK